MGAIMRLLISLVLGTLLAGCQTQAERVAEQEREVEDMIVVYGPACDRLGYQRNSDPWRDCLLRLSTKDSLDRYSGFPVTTSCFGHHGFLQCTSF